MSWASLWDSSCLWLLQVLEDVCQKHGFNPDEHGLKYVGIFIISWPALLPVFAVKLVSGWLREEVISPDPTASSENNDACDTFSRIFSTYYLITLTNIGGSVHGYWHESFSKAPVWKIWQHLMVRKNIANNVNVSLCFLIFHLILHLFYMNCVMVKITKNFKHFDVLCYFTFLLKSKEVLLNINQCENTTTISIGHYFRFGHSWLTNASK